MQTLAAIIFLHFFHLYTGIVTIHKDYVSAALYVCGCVATFTIIITNTRKKCTAPKVFIMLSIMFFRDIIEGWTWKEPYIIKFFTLNIRQVNCMCVCSSAYLFLFFYIHWCILAVQHRILKSFRINNVNLLWRWHFLNN